MVRIHRYDEGKIVPAGRENAFNTSAPTFLSGGGGLVSTIGDYWRFAQMILNGGEFAGRRYLKDETVAMMHKSVLEPGVNVTLYSPKATGMGFGMDFGIIEDPVAARTAQGVESFYWGGGVRHLVLDRPDQRHDRHRHDPEHGRHHPGRRAR